MKGSPFGSLALINSSNLGSVLFICCGMTLYTCTVLVFNCILGCALTLRDYLLLQTLYRWRLAPMVCCIMKTSTVFFPLVRLVRRFSLPTHHTARWMQTHRYLHRCFWSTSTTGYTERSWSSFLNENITTAFLGQPTKELRQHFKNGQIG